MCYRPFLLAAHLQWDSARCNFYSRSDVEHLSKASSWPSCLSSFSHLKLHFCKLISEA